MKISEVMTASVETCSPEDTLQAVAERMASLDVGAIPICESERIIGMITDRDIVVRAVAKGEDISTCKAGDVMSPDIVFCSPDDSVSEAAQLMAARQIRRLVVIDDQKKLCGIVALGDLAIENQDDKLTGRVLGHISEPASSPTM